jgi:hypothetical protein
MKRTFLLFLALLLMACPPLAAEEIAVDLDPSRTAVAYTPAMSCTPSVSTPAQAEWEGLESRLKEELGDSRI